MPTTRTEWLPADGEKCSNPQKPKVTPKVGRGGWWVLERLPVNDCIIYGPLWQQALFLADGYSPIQSHGHGSHEVHLLASQLS